MRRMRLLALFLDVLVCALAADAAGLGLTFVIWRYLPPDRAIGAIRVVWALGGLAAVAAFLLRDRRGGRARRWLALEARRPDGSPPGAWGSIRRNMPLLVPFWNIYDAWPLRADGEAPRRSDRHTGIRIRRSD
jgi:hypothetical protein